MGLVFTPKGSCRIIVDGKIRISFAKRPRKNGGPMWRIHVEAPQHMKIDIIKEQVYDQLQDEDEEDPVL